VSDEIEDLSKTYKTVFKIHEDAEEFIYKNDIISMLGLAPKIIEF
jgi:hypothetical protein